MCTCSPTVIHAKVIFNANVTTFQLSQIAPLSLNNYYSITLGLKHVIISGRHTCRCYTARTFAEMALGTPGCIPQNFVKDITELMDKVLQIPPQNLREIEEGSHIWCTFIPYVSLLYSPQRKGTVSDSPLYTRSVNVLLHLLISALKQKVHRDILCQEKLVEYTLCLQWLVPSECQSMAGEVVRELVECGGLKPPSLGTLAKATLAMTRFGLPAVREVNSAAELFHLY